ncbi:hypothetical protein PGTUg99_034809 [Puccinia graminis f. sp. tritici]|uniref:Uncharacterized protein n=1 Tax=Puccinia graminis f. sp. tritici TaxID=56615 RepID=A0A5B0SA17_PUCGR|nr:hypothetical protein PGTUg99_034809 [Puccinia graminis f. sp. tritici]
MPRRLEGNLSSRRGCASPVGRTSPAGRKPFQPAIGSGYPLGYPDIRQVWGGKRPSTAESAPPGGYPLGPAGIRQRITDIRSGLSATISSPAERQHSQIISPDQTSHPVLRSQSQSAPSTWRPQWKPLGPDGPACCAQEAVHGDRPTLC